MDGKSYSSCLSPSVSLLSFRSPSLLLLPRMKLVVSFCRLLYVDYGFLGANDGSIFPSKNKAQYPCVFVDPLGGLKEICVPFHFALNSKNGKRARDVHLLRKLRTFLREEDFNETKLVSEVTDICLDLETNEIRIQMIEALMNSKHILPDALLAATDCFVTKRGTYATRTFQRKKRFNATVRCIPVTIYKLYARMYGFFFHLAEDEGKVEEKVEREEEEESELSAKMLCRLTMQLQRVIIFYKYVKSLFDLSPEYDITRVDNATGAKDLSLTLLTSEREVNRVIKLARTLNNVRDGDVLAETKVKFKDDDAFFYFLSCFELGTSRSIGLRKDVNEESVREICKYAP